MTVFAPLGHARGPADAPVTVEMYGNYECLHCRRAWPAVEALLAELGDAVRFVHRHFARPADFPHAELAAEAAEAAAAEGKFWAMHALLMAAPSLHPEVLLASAAALGLDVARVEGALAARTYRDAVRAEHALGFERGVTRTPTFHVDGVPVPPAADLSALRGRLDEVLGAVR
jgi:Na+:H+ antiporter, NhaA family